MAVIPQDPMLFRGTLRFNLDPTNQFTDSQLWEALENTYLKQKVRTNFRILHKAAIQIK